MDGGRRRLELRTGNSLTRRRFYLCVLGATPSYVVLNAPLGLDLSVLSARVNHPNPYKLLILHVNAGRLHHPHNLIMLVRAAKAALQTLRLRPQVLNDVVMAIVVYDEPRLE